MEDSDEKGFFSRTIIRKGGWKEGRKEGSEIAFLFPEKKLT